MPFYLILLRQTAMPRSRRQVALRRYRAFIVALTAIAFALLVSVAATHLHVSPAGDSDCEICSAVAGKLTSPPAVAIAPASPLLTALPVAAPVLIQVARVAPELLPPSRGPPLTA